MDGDTRNAAPASRFPAAFGRYVEHRSPHNSARGPTMPRIMPRRDALRITDSGPQIQTRRVPRLDEPSTIYAPKEAQIVEGSYRGGTGAGEDGAQ